MMTKASWAVSLIACLLQPLPHTQDDGVARIRVLVEKLGAESIEDREKAAVELKLLGSKALPELRSAAASEDRAVAERAKALVRIISLRTQLTPRILEAAPDLADRIAVNNNEWTHAFLELSRFKSGLPVYPTLTHSDFECLLHKATENTSLFDDQILICKAIGRKRLQAGLPYLLKLLSDSDPWVRAGAIDALGELPSSAHSKTLRELLTHPRGCVREAAATALSSLHASDSGADICRLLQDEDDWVQWSAVKALEKLRFKDATKSAMRMLESALPRNREFGVELLGLLSAEAAMPAIRRSLRDPVSSVRAKAAEALGRLEARDASEEIVALLEDPNERVRINALECIATLRPAGVARSLKRALEDSREYVRGSALDALASCVGSQAAREIERGLSDDSAFVRAQAVAASGRLNLEEARARVIALLEDRDPSVRYEAIRALIKWPGKGHVEAITTRLTDTNEETRILAAASLSSLGNKSGLKVLIEQSSDLTVVNAAANSRLWNAIDVQCRQLPQGGSLGDSLATIAKNANATINWEGDTKGCQYRLSRTPLKAHPRIQLNVHDLLSGIILELGDCCQVVLDGDQIRLMPYVNARNFWLEWLKRTSVVK